MGSGVLVIIWEEIVGTGHALWLTVEFDVKKAVKPVRKSKIAFIKSTRLLYNNPQNLSKLTPFLPKLLAFHIRLWDDL